MLRILMALMLLALPAAALRAAPAASQSYILGPLDQIEVNVANYPELKTTTRIGPDGAIILPLVGSVTVGGLTPPDAANEIETHYVNGGFIKLPSIRVEIVDFQSRKASVLGQVNNQGLVVLDRSYSVAEVLAKAGGLGPEAADTAIIIRQKPDGSSERLTVDIGQLVAATGPSGLTEVRAGDVVFVPKAPTFSVIGAANKPGTYPITAGMTVQQALAAAGDVARIGTRSHLKIRRVTAAGKDAVVIDAKPDDRVQPGDVIVVKERLF